MFFEIGPGTKWQNVGHTVGQLHGVVGGSLSTGQARIAVVSVVATKICQKFATGRDVAHVHGANCHQIFWGGTTQARRHDGHVEQFVGGKEIGFEVLKSSSARRYCRFK